MKEGGNERGGGLASLQIIADLLELPIMIKPSRVWWPVSLQDSEEESTFQNVNCFSFFFLNPRLKR